MKCDILVVDDEPEFQALLLAMLTRAGFAPRAVASASQALIAIQQKQPHAIVLDDMMPGMTGAELCGMLKKDALTKSIPIVVYTAGVRYHLDDWRSRIGADAALMKNGRFAELIETLRGLLGASV